MAAALTAGEVVGACRLNSSARRRLRRPRVLAIDRPRHTGPPADASTQHRCSRPAVAGTGPRACLRSRSGREKGSARAGLESLLQPPRTTPSIQPRSFSPPRESPHVDDEIRESRNVPTASTVGDEFHLHVSPQPDLRSDAANPSHAWRRAGMVGPIDIHLESSFKDPGRWSPLHLRFLIPLNWALAQPLHLEHACPSFVSLRCRRQPLDRPPQSM